MNDIFSLLAEARSRPGMVIGYGPEDVRERLNGLHTMIAGYEWALENHDVREPGRTFLSDLADHIRETRKWSLSCGPMGAILEHSQSPQEAWGTFWSIVDELRREKYPETLEPREPERSTPRDR